MITIHIWWLATMLVVVATSGVAVGIWMRSEQATVPVWSDEGDEQ